MNCDDFFLAAIDPDPDEKLDPALLAQVPEHRQSCAECRELEKNYGKVVALAAQDAPAPCPRARYRASRRSSWRSPASAGADLERASAPAVLLRPARRGARRGDRLLRVALRGGVPGGSSAAPPARGLPRRPRQEVAAARLDRSQPSARLPGNPTGGDGPRSVPSPGRAPSAVRYPPAGERAERSHSMSTISTGSKGINPKSVESGLELRADTAIQGLQTALPSTVTQMTVGGHGLHGPEPHHLRADPRPAVEERSVRARHAQAVHAAEAGRHPDPDRLPRRPQGLSRVRPREVERDADQVRVQALQEGEAAHLGAEDAPRRQGEADAPEAWHARLAPEGRARDRRDAVGRDLPHRGGHDRARGGPGRHAAPSAAARARERR